MTFFSNLYRYHVAGDLTIIAGILLALLFSSRGYSPILGFLFGSIPVSIMLAVVMSFQDEESLRRLKEKDEITSRKAART
jgi:hypothetical protein